MPITVDAMTIKHALAFASALYHVERVRFVVADNELSIKSVCASNVSMVHLVIPVEDCSDFTVGVDIAVFQKALGSVLKREPRTIELDVVEYTPPNNSGGDVLDEHAYRLKLISPPYSHLLKYINPHSIRKDPKIPNIELDNHVSISPKVVHTAFERTFGDYVIIANIDGDFTISSDEDEDEDSSKYKSHVGVFGDVSNTSTLVKMAELSPMIAALQQSSDLVVISHSQDYPIKIEATFGKDDKADVMFLTAPRIESE